MGVFGTRPAAAETVSVVDLKVLHAKIGELTLKKNFLSGALSKSGRVLGEMRLSGSVNEVSDLALLDGPGRHGLISHTDALHRDALAPPEMGFWSVNEAAEQSRQSVH